MIDKSELRIGNMVLFNDNTDRKGIVIELNEHYAKLKTNYIPDHRENVVSAVTVDYDSLWAIPLTEDILLKCGFLKDLGSMFSLNNVEVRFIRNEFNYGLNPYLWVDLKYIHQLQNLYFSIIGKELEVNF